MFIYIFSSSAPGIRLDGGDISTFRVLSWSGRPQENSRWKQFSKQNVLEDKRLSSKYRGRYGKGDMAVEAVPWFQLSNDVSIKQFKFIVEIGFSFLDSIPITARYAKSRGTFYVQLEDDVLTKKGFISIMKHFALEKIADKQSWSYYIFARIQNLFSKALHQQILKKWNFSLQVCYWLLSTGFHWKDVQICGTSLACSVLPHVLQR